jgi:hypothetical protein
MTPIQKMTFRSMNVKSLESVIALLIGHFPHVNSVIFSRILTCPPRQQSATKSKAALAGS